MITEENKAIVHRYFEEVLNQRHLSSIDELFAPHFISHPTGADVHATVDLNTYVQAIARSHAAFPDLHVTIEAQIAEADLVATRWKAHGTQRGRFGNLPPTDKEVTATAMHFHRLDHGKIVEHWEQFDLLGLLTQLGALPQGKALSE